MTEHGFNISITGNWIKIILCQLPVVVPDIEIIFCQYCCVKLMIWKSLWRFWSGYLAHSNSHHSSALTSGATESSAVILIGVCINEVFYNFGTKYIHPSTSLPIIKNSKSINIICQLTFFIIHLSLSIERVFWQWKLNDGKSIDLLHQSSFVIN